MGYILFTGISNLNCLFVFGLGIFCRKKTCNRGFRYFS